MLQIQLSHPSFFPHPVDLIMSESDPPLPPRKPRGRPPKPKRKVVQVIANNPVIPSGPRAETPAPPAADIDAPETQGIPLVGEDARHALLAAQNPARTGILASADTSGKRPFLNAVSHTEEDGWMLAARMPTEDFAPWFDDVVCLSFRYAGWPSHSFQLNEFHAYQMLPEQNVDPATLAVIVRWIGHPGDSPRDPRARRCFIRWNNPRPPQALIDRAIIRRQPVLRWDLRCAGVHDLDFSTPVVEEHVVEVEDEETEEQVADFTDATPVPEPEPAAQPSRWDKCSGKVRIHVRLSLPISFLASF